MASVGAIQISDEEEVDVVDMPPSTLLTKIVSEVDCLPSSEDDDECDAPLDNGDDDTDVSLHLSDIEEQDIFAAKLERFEVLKQRTVDRLALQPLEPPSPPLLTPTPEPPTGATKRPVRGGARRSQRRKVAEVDSQPEKDYDFDLDLDDLDASPGPVPRRDPFDRSLDALLTQLSQTDDEKVVEDSPAPRPESADTTDDAERTFTARVQAGRLIIRLQMKRSEKLQLLFDAVADELSVPVGRVCLGQRDVIYSPHQTPDDVRLGPFDVIEFWEGDSAAAAAAAPAPDADSIELKVQSADRRSTVVLRLGRSEPMAVLMDKYAAERGVPLAELRFRFDGETLDPADTPETLDLEGGECVDVHSC